MSREDARLTWSVAEAIHRRCCGRTACNGVFEHLGAAAAAIEALAPRTPPAPAIGRRLSRAA